MGLAYAQGAGVVSAQFQHFPRVMLARVGIEYEIPLLDFVLEQEAFIPLVLIVLLLQCFQQPAQGVLTVEKGFVVLRGKVQLPLQPSVWIFAG